MLEYYLATKFEDGRGWLTVNSVIFMRILFSRIEYLGLGHDLPIPYTVPHIVQDKHDL